MVFRTGGHVPELKVARSGSRDGGGTEDTGVELKLRARVAKGFTRVEDVVYIGLGLLLAGTAVALLLYGIFDFGARLLDGTMRSHVVELLDRILLILLIVEILLTVQVSFREHALVPEPFLIVGLIAVTRRILVLTAEFEQLLRGPDSPFRNAMLELALLTGMVLVLVVSLVLLRKRAAPAAVEKA
jgi:phosphate starvation-inducible membrane PsiE